MLANTARLNAFAMCMLQQFNVMDSNGMVNPDVMSYSIISTVPNATAGISQQCISKRGIDAVNTARMIMNCYLRANQMVLALSRRDRTYIIRINYITVACPVLAYLQASFSPLIENDFHAYEADCGAKSGASDESIEAARRARQLPQSPQMNAFALCMMQKYKVMAADGSVNPDVRSYGIITDGPDNTWRVSEHCRDLDGNSSGETARMIMNCYLDNNQLVMGLTPRVSA
ncbi:hypothetical protein TSAR_001460 [Trichomalopsis sarcophagae]|uniref:Uncharacterized protein n=1 Tax=Trichomalopsis sarcophagae TaxID=543379 RepID=A0A232EYB3_9HYME|nr:hypothetical protein TSAR_001460 [Trichomalopsis sarcophagae]